MKECRQWKTSFAEVGSLKDNHRSQKTFYERQSVMKEDPSKFLFATDYQNLVLDLYKLSLSSPWTKYSPEEMFPCTMLPVLPEFFVP